MSEKLRLHNPVNIGGQIGFLAKGEYVLGKEEGALDPIILKHWLIKAMLNDGKAAVIKEPEKEDNDTAGSGEEKKTSRKKSSGSVTVDESPANTATGGADEKASDGSAGENESGE
jgi:hypothetical protein